MQVQVIRAVSAVGLVAALAMPAALVAPATSATAAPVPAPAPRPTDSGASPAAPDPHPPRGGRGPDGRAVGGPRLLSRGLVLPDGAPRLPSTLTAASWLVADLDTGAVLAARDPHGRYQPASIQKVLTAVTLAPLLPGRRRVTVTRRAAETEGSHAGLVPGGRYRVDQLFAGLLLVSGNDCAEALAAAAGGRERTVGLMNRTAASLGAYDTLVETPSGLDGWGQLTSAYDMTMFLRAALTQPRLARYDRLHRGVLPDQPVGGFGPVVMDNQNELFLRTVPGALFVKTGFTDAAQHTFVGAVERGGHRYGVVLLRAQRWPVDQWVQATKLVTWATKLSPETAPVGQLQASEPARTDPVYPPLARVAAPVPSARAADRVEAPGFGVWVPLLAASGLVGVALAFARRVGRTR